MWIELFEYNLIKVPLMHSHVCSPTHMAYAIDSAYVSPDI